MRLLFLALLCILPMSAHGAVIISEVAWMGSAQSANDEWIEIHNTGGSAVSVDGWLFKDGANLQIPLAGTIAAGAYAVLERTDDSSAPGNAFLIYTGALANTGSVLSLYKTDGSLEDQVAGGENWESIGGDNLTKETAQHTSAGWKTASPTPGRGLSVSEVPEEEEEDTVEEISEEESDDDQDTDNKVIEMQLPDISLDLSLLAPDIVFVHQPVLFEVLPKGLGPTALNSLEYEWNFGDFNTQGGKTGKHVYDHPGEYVVTVFAEYARHTQAARKNIKVLPVDFSLTFDAKGNVLLHNDAKYEVNISDYKLKGSETFIFPKRSVILPGSSIAVPRSKLIQDAHHVPVVLYDQEGEFVATTATVTLPSPIASLKHFIGDVSAASVAEASDEPVLEPQAAILGNFSFDGEVLEETATNTENRPIAAPATPIEKEPFSFPQGTLPLLGLFGIVTLGLIAVFAGGRTNGTQ